MPDDTDDPSQRPTPPERPSRPTPKPSAPPPRASPRPLTPETWNEPTPKPSPGSLPPEQGTNPGIKLERLDKADKDRKKRRPWYVALAGTALSGSLGTGSVGLYHGLKARDAADATVIALGATLANETAERHRLEDKVDKNKTMTDRMDAKLDLLLDKAKVPQSARPPKE